MRTWKIWVMGLGLGLLVGGSAAAALGSAKWNYFKSDLIRCIDAMNLGINACGTENVGSDLIRRGSVLVSGKTIVAQVIQAAPDQLYFVDFVPLRNTGDDPDGSYEAEERVFVGALFTNRVGNGTLRAENFDIIGPQLGYFVFSTPNGEIEITGLSHDEAEAVHAQQFEGELRQFVTGFDPQVSDSQRLVPPAL
ncbi:hypothetical protein HY374_04210 [Candidatus Berkelbacteria bacterium]|nr:hypothetical protein [Candidatus Berkelbacteria bacterium]